MRITAKCRQVKRSAEKSTTKVSSSKISKKKKRSQIEGNQKVILKNLEKREVNHKWIGWNWVCVFFVAIILRWGDLKSSKKLVVYAQKRNIAGGDIRRSSYKNGVRIYNFTTTQQQLCRSTCGVRATNRCRTSSSRRMQSGGWNSIVNFVLFGWTTNRVLNNFIPQFLCLRFFLWKKILLYFS